MIKFQQQSAFFHLLPGMYIHAAHFAGHFRADLHPLQRPQAADGMQRRLPVLIAHPHRRDRSRWSRIGRQIFLHHIGAEHAIAVQAAKQQPHADEHPDHALTHFTLVHDSSPVVLMIGLADWVTVFLMICLIVFLMDSLSVYQPTWQHLPTP